MKKKLFVVAAILAILIFISTGAAAYTIDRVLTQGIGVKGLLYADWQMDYYLPLNPEELNRGDYRFSANMGRVGIDDDMILGFDEQFNNYFIALDTGITDNLSMRLSYDYTPMIDDDEDELDNKVYAAYFNYSMKKDKSLYFGYNKLRSDYNDKIDPSYNEDSDIDYYFIGFEKRGSFLSKNK